MYQKLSVSCVLACILIAFSSIAFAAKPVPTNLTLTVTDSPDPVAAGSELVYHYTVVNNGPSTANAVKVRDTFPATVTVSGLPGNCNGTTAVVCNLGRMTNGASRSFDITVTVNLGVFGLMSNTATVSANRADTIPADNTVTVDTIVACGGVTVTGTMPDGVEGTPYPGGDADGAGGNPPYTFTSSGDLPGGLNLDAATGILSGTPDTTGTFLFTIFATDDNDCIGSADYVVIINDAACPAITLTPSTLSNGTAGILYDQDLAATGAAAPVTFSLLTGSTPDGITLDSDGKISGVSPAPETATFEVLAEDSNGCLASQEYTLTIDAPVCGGITLTPTQVPDGVVGVPYVAQDIDATGGTPGYTFNFSGSMPPGVTLDSGTGVISGTPDPNSSDTYVFTVFAVDSNDCVGSEDYVININDPGCPAITVNPSSLPDGAVGVAYDEQLSQTGGANPVDFDIVSGDTPSGITMDLNGSITGTPDTPGTSDFIGRVVDKNGCLATREYSITIIGDTALFFDDFDNAVVDWQVIKPSFNETTVPGSLRGVPVGRKAVVVASPVFAGCSTCNIETHLSTAGGPFAKVWVLGWWTDKRNTIELLLKESVNKWVMKERVGGVVVKKAKGLSTINPNTVYDVLITYNGTTFEVFVDGVSLFQMTPVSAHTGTVGFQVANTSANFNDITVD